MAQRTIRSAVSHQVAQFDQVMADSEIRVELFDFPLQQADAVLCPLQALVGADDADVVPHEAAQFVPVVGDDDFFVSIGDAAFVPLRQMWQSAAALLRSMSLTAASAKTRHSSREFEARRFAPCSPVQEASPASIKTGHIGTAARSLTMPPQV